jgi:hemolysin III
MIENANLSAIEEHGKSEEITNSITHGIGAALSVAGLAVLVTFASLMGDPWRIVSFSVYGATLILLYLSSCFYHGFTRPDLKRLFRVFDHAAIYLLIAGTYTPFLLVTLRGVWGWSLFGIIWGLAAIGVVTTILFMDRLKILSVAAYLGMGWIVVFAIKPLVSLLPLGGMVWLTIGGVFYTLGVVFYVWKRLPFNHAIWHLFVLGGSISHFVAILFYVLPD